MIRHSARLKGGADLSSSLLMLCHSLSPLLGRPLTPKFYLCVAIRRKGCEKESLLDGLGALLLGVE